MNIIADVKSSPPTRHLSQLSELLSLCRDAFTAFDEVWLIGPKSDHHKNLIDLGALREDQVTVSHVHSHLGLLRAGTVITPLNETSQSFDNILTNIHPDLTHEMRRIAAHGKRVCVLMPHPNVMFNAAIKELGATDNFVMTAPINDDVVYKNLESKLHLSSIVSAALREKANDYSIRSVAVSKKISTLDAVRNLLSARKEQALYLQEDLSVGGEGTVRVDSQTQYTEFLNGQNSRQDSRPLKATIEIVDAYPANGSACIVPLPGGECEVFVNPLSHKPTNIEEINMQPHCGNGNDWSTVWPEEVQRQYLELTQAIGRELHTRYGYTGIFGPDCLVEKRRDGTLQLRITEINPRWQGTTPYQTYNALIAEQLPLELVHYIIKLDTTGEATKNAHRLLGDSATYNQRSTHTPGCFYIKIGAPKKPSIIKNDLNGTWVYDDDNLRRSHATSNLGHSTSIPNKTSITITSLSEGTVTTDNFLAVGYITGRSHVPIFSPHSPQLSEYAQGLLRAVKRRLFDEVTS